MATKSLSSDSSRSSGRTLDSSSISGRVGSNFITLDIDGKL